MPAPKTEVTFKDYDGSLVRVSDPPKISKEAKDAWKKYKWRPMLWEDIAKEWFCFGFDAANSD